VTDWPSWRCPDHAVDLTETASDVLSCERGHHYAVVRGIPRFVAEHTYADAFGLQWTRYRRTQLDSYTGASISEERLRRCLGESVWNDLAGRQVLECGCGAGRFTEVLLAQGASVTSIDLSDAVDANAENCPIGHRHRVAAADIARLPFAPGQYDVVVCLGVIQHTPNSELAVRQLYEQVRPGGWLVIDHYAPDWRRYTRTAPLFRLAFRRLSPERGLRLSEWLVRRLLPLHRATADRPLARAVVNRMSPVASYYRMYPQLNAELQKQWALLDTHDYLTDHYRRHRSVSQIRHSLHDLGADAIWCESGGNGVEARARRPD
jgi:SAM-dependent methyltransferase